MTDLTVNTGFSEAHRHTQKKKRNPSSTNYGLEEQWNEAQFHDVRIMVDNFFDPSHCYLFKNRLIALKL